MSEAVPWVDVDTHDDVAAALAAAEDAVRPAPRYLAAHAAALRVAATVLAVRRPRLTGRRGVWEVVAAVAPELGEWAAYFGALELKRQAVAAGASGIVGTREADDLVRDARAFAAAAQWYRRRGYRGRGYRGQEYRGQGDRGGQHGRAGHG